MESLVFIENPMCKLGVGQDVRFLIVNNYQSFNESIFCDKNIRHFNYTLLGNVYLNYTITDGLYS